MKGKLVGICVCTLVLIVTALSVAATMKSTQASSMELGLVHNEKVVSEAGVLDGRQDDYDWQRSGNNVFTGHGGAYPSAYVGIGTTTPGARLHIKDNAPQVRFEESDQSNKLWHIAGFNGGLAFTETGVADCLYLAPGGRVGVGTIYPSAKLDVEVSSGGAATIGSASNSATGDYSLALGEGNTALGESSIAMGYGTWADDDFSVALGHETTAVGWSSTALGHGTNAQGLGSTAMGVLSLASGERSTAMGEDTTASGIWSTAMGYATTASGDCSTAMGYCSSAGGEKATAAGFWADASGGYSTAMGYGPIASGGSSTALGHNTNAAGHYSTAMGFQTEANGEISTSMGTMTQANGDYSTALGGFVTVDGEYSVGIGLSDTPYTVTPNNVLSIMGGKVGIGTTSPLYLLDVAGGSDLVAQFSGRVKGADAVNDDEFATKSQVDTIVSTYLQSSVMQTRFTPSGTDDPQGNIGDITYDDHYMYVKTPAGWKRSALETW